MHGVWQTRRTCAVLRIHRLDVYFQLDAGVVIPSFSHTHKASLLSFTRLSRQDATIGCLKAAHEVMTVGCVSRSFDSCLTSI
jgi:hypothetical protein